jgi:hypothetical protein
MQLASVSEYPVANCIFFSLLVVRNPKDSYFCASTIEHIYIKLSS